MPNKADRKRPIQVKFFVDEKEACCHQAANDGVRHG